MPLDLGRAERIAGELTVRLAVAAAAISIVALADSFLDWDLLGGVVERLAGFLVAALFVVLATAALVAASLALRRIADALERRAAPPEDGLGENR